MQRRDMLVGSAGLLSLVLSGCDRTSEALKRIRTQFGWLFDAHHAGFILALERGFYTAARQNVTLQPGGTDTSPVRMVVSATAEIGQAGGVEQLVTAAVENLPIQPIAAIHNKTPHAIISTSRNPIHRPEDLRGKTVAVAFGDAAEVLLKTLLRQSGISESELKLVPFRFDLTPLVRGQVDAITGFRTDQPATLASEGVKPVVLAYEDFGVSSYGYTLFATRDYVVQHRPEVDAFLKASRAGWKESFANPDAAIDALGRFLRAPVNRPVELAKLKLIRSIMLTPAGELYDWALDPRRVDTVVGYLEQAGQVPGTVSRSEILNRLAIST